MSQTTKFSSPGATKNAENSYPAEWRDILARAGAGELSALPASASEGLAGTCLLLLRIAPWASASKGCIHLLWWLKKTGRSVAKRSTHRLPAVLTGWLAAGQVDE